MVVIEEAFCLFIPNVYVIFYQKYLFFENIEIMAIFLQIKESMVATERHHKDTLQQMEHKFFEEKVLALFHVVEHTVYVTCNVLVK